MDGWSKKLTPLGYLFLYMGVEPKIGGKPPKSSILIRLLWVLWVSKLAGLLKCAGV